MKSLKLILIIIVAGLFACPPVFAEEKEPDYPIFTDIVHEWSSSGKIMQLGDHTIIKINSVWLDKGHVDVEGKKVLTKANTAYIEAGKPATAVLEGKNKNGQYTAHKIIVYSGKGLDKAVKKLSPSQKKTFYSYQE